MKDTIKAEIKRLSDQLDSINHKSQPLLESGNVEKLGELMKEKVTIEEELQRLREAHTASLSKEAQKLQKLGFQRAITKKEQADMGALKKRVRGIIVVHPMTALGREMGLETVTGFAREQF